MESNIQLYKDTITLLMIAYAQGRISHNGNSCAVTHILGGDMAWLNVVHPRTGTIDHQFKLTNPKEFAKGLAVISESGFTVEQIIRLEAGFSGRQIDESGARISTFDDGNDPDCNLGMNGILSILSELNPPRHLEKAAKVAVV